MKDMEDIIKKQLIEEVKTLQKQIDKQKKEELLRQSEGKLNAMLQSIGDHMSMLDKDLTIIWANDIAKKIFGNDIIGRKCYEVYHRRKEPCEPYPCLTLKAFQDGKIHEHDTQVIDKDGQMMYLHCTANVALRDEEGKPTAVIEVSRDITRRKKAEETLRHAEEKYRSIFDNAVEGIFQTTPEGRIISTNPALARIFGYDSPEDMMSSVTDIGRQLYIDPEKRKEHLRLLNEKGVVKNYEAQMYRKDGSTNWVSMNTRIVRDDAGKLLLLEGFVEDITARKQAEARLLEEKKYSETLIDSIPEIFYLIDENGRILKWNKNAEIITGYSAEEISKMGPLDFFVDGDKRLVEKAIHDVFTKGESTTEAHLISKEVNEVLYLFTGRLLTLGNQNYLVGTGLDISERKKAEEALRESEEKYRAIVEDQTELICRFLPGGQLTFVNDAYCRYFGREQGDLVGSSFLPLIPEEDRQSISQMQELITKENPVTHEHRVILKDGQIQWQQWSNRGIFDEHGHLIEFQAVGRDITKRKQAEEALQESESRYRALFEEAIDAIFVADVETGIIIDCNESALRLVGKERSEIIGSHQKTLHLPEAGDGKFSSTFLKHRDQLQVETIETTVVTKSGEIKDVAIRASVIELRGKKIMQANFRDITERKRTEESLKQLMHKHQLILDAAGEGIVGLDLGGKITFANPFAVKTTGYKIEELTGQELHKLVHYQKPDGTPYPYEECPSYETLKNGTPKNIRDEVFFKKDGTSFPVRYTSTPIIEESVIKGAVVTFRDITERKRLEEQFLQAQKMEAVGHLAGGVAHDFNNILTAIIGYGNLLQMKIKEDDPLRAYINQILLSSEKAANLTHGLLAFSRKQIINPKPVNLNDIVKNVEKLLLRLIGEDIELQTLLADKDLIVMADSGQIEQVLMNLATNARDAMPEGGTLIISTEIVELDREYIITSGYGKPGKYALISVADTGKGIDEKTKGFIFEPFFTTKERERGTGLGLAVVYGIVKQHNGNIDVYSELDKGTTFRIYLPIIEEEVEETKPKVIITPIGGKETVLIAEDNIDVRNYTKTVLEEFGYKVIEAVNGEDAINRFMENKDRIELLLLDVIMPKKNGKEVYDAIKKVRPDIKALFMSGYAEDIIHRKGILEEGLNFVLKPISPQELLKRIREILESKK